MPDNAEKWLTQEQVISIRRVSETEWHGVLLVNGQMDEVYKGSTLAEVIDKGIHEVRSSTFPVGTRMLLRTVIEQPVPPEVTSASS